MKIGIVNDMPLAVEALRRALATRPGYDVLWVAQDGQQALDFCIAQRPDIVLMDLVMPHVDGVEATRRIMAQAPCAILIVTIDVGANAWRVYEAMGAGALDAVDTPSLGGPEAHKSTAVLLSKIERIVRSSKNAMHPLPARGPQRRMGRPRRRRSSPSAHRPAAPPRCRGCWRACPGISPRRS